MDRLAPGTEPATRHPRLILTKARLHLAWRCEVPGSGARDGLLFSVPVEPVQHRWCRAPNKGVIRSLWSFNWPHGQRGCSTLG